MARSEAAKVVGELGLGAQRGLDGENDIAGQIGDSRNCAKVVSVLSSVAHGWCCRHTSLCGARNRPHDVVFLRQ
jgi:hypothetical protein